MCMCLALLQYVRWLLDNKYTVDPDGIPGNDDYGEMCYGVVCVWYIASWTAFIM